jgi:hypothetical protein
VGAGRDAVTGGRVRTARGGADATMGCIEMYEHRVLLIERIGVEGPGELALGIAVGGVYERLLAGDDPRPPVGCSS